MGMYGLSRQKVTNLWADNTYRRLSVNGALAGFGPLIVTTFGYVRTGLVPFLRANRLKDGCTEGIDFMLQGRNNFHYIKVAWL